ncbi:acyltransferase [Colletotrichum navitas]|uniref:Acyltransferase n=1 Tax=Colletotrichum navitas TaxID=681940 RepID=A0AAD8UX86_9PEZI|nr:acyltransferase [Colletotrichum navitas]KAK1564160.1 acyltransferase [Colletotrichum navitas]
MPRIEEFHIRPLGWESGPEEERFKLSTLDYMSPRTYNNYALFFKVKDEDKSKVAEVLKEGLERALAQAIHLVGTIEKDEDGFHSFVKRKSSTVKLVVQYLDSPDDKFPSFAEIEKSHFVTTTLGDIKILSNAPMTYGETPEAHPDSSPVTASFKANFIPGGLIFNMHSHHYSNDISGWGSFTKQLAENCSAIVNKTEFPSFDPGCLDRSRFNAPAIPEESRVDAPPQAGRHPEHKRCQSLIFHMPKSKAAELKKAASPDDGSWISTYDAVVALAWRTFSKIREPVYKPDPLSNPIWGEAINMTKRLTDPKMPARMQGNVFFAAVSATAPVPQLTVSEIVSEAPLSKLAAYARRMTDSVTGEALAGALRALAPIRNKADLSIRVDSFPPMSVAMTDWRDADVCTADFGFAKPTAFRHLFNPDTVINNIIIVYPPRRGPAGDDEGIELHAGFERELVHQLVDDPEWKKYFEFRGVDADEGISGTESGCGV